MSKTDKTAPYWVQKRDGKIRHDHSTGVCVIETPEHHSARHHWSHSFRCRKRIEVTTYCTKAEPRISWERVTSWKLGEPVKCWDRRRTYDYDAQGIPHFAGWHVTQCAGHNEVTWDHSVPCSCDEREVEATCWHDTSHIKYRHRRDFRDDYRLRRGRDNRRAIAEGLEDHEETRLDALADDALEATLAAMRAEESCPACG